MKNQKELNLQEMSDVTGGKRRKLITLADVWARQNRRLKQALNKLR